MFEKLLVSLDLDETLIYTEDVPARLALLERDNQDMFTIDDEPIFFRPFVKEFIQRLISNDDIEVGVFTASCLSYSDPIIEELFGSLDVLSHLFHDDRVTLKDKQSPYPYSNGINKTYLKDLKKVLRHTKHNVERIIAIDDSMVYDRHRGNTIIVPAYMAQCQDNILECLWNDIEFLIDKPNVRDYIKNHKVVV